jgi:hypothetical protein
MKYPMTRTKALLFFLFLLMAAYTYGQKKETGPTHYDSCRVVSFSIHKLDSTIFIENANKNIDTTSRYFHIYDPQYKSYLLSESLGNIGLACQNMVYHPVLNTGFSLGINSHNPYKSSDNDQNYFYSLLPFTDIYFSQGFKKEQAFRVTHFHSVRQKLFMGATYNIINAPGRDYNRQKATDHALSVFMYYQTKNKRYGVFADYLFTSIKNQENGGLITDSSYLNFRNGSSSTIPDYYFATTNGPAALSFSKESDVNLKQYYFLVKNDSVKINDSTKTGRKLFLGRFVHSFDFTTQKYGYTADINHAYFPLVPMDSSAIADSFSIYQIKNAIEWTNYELNQKGKQSWFRYSAKITHSYTEIRQAGTKIHFINLIPSLRLDIKPMENLSFDVGGEYVLLNRYKNDFSVSASAAYTFYNKGIYYGSLTLEGNYHLKEPDWFYQNYHSHYFNWDNDFQKESIWYAGLNYTYKNLKAGVDYYNEFNPVYMNAMQRPDQYVNGTMQVFNAYIFKKFVFWKFEIDNKVVYQVTDKPALLRKPALIAMQSYVFSTHMFKKALFLQGGIDLNYNTKYYADGYQFALQQFYLQNTRQVGNYLNATAFLNLKVKRVRIFVKLSNFLSGLISYDNFTVPHYPMPDREFTLGLNWLFHD